MKATIYKINGQTVMYVGLQPEIFLYEEVKKIKEYNIDIVYCIARDNKEN